MSFRHTKSTKKKRVPISITNRSSVGHLASGTGRPQASEGPVGPRSRLATQGSERRADIEKRNTLFRKMNTESLAHTHLAVLLSRIMGFRCYTGASDVRVYRQRPKAQYKLNTDTPRLQRLQGLDVPFLTQSAVLETLQLSFSSFLLALVYSCVCGSIFLMSVAYEKEPNVWVCLLGQMNIWNDRGWLRLEC